MMEMQEQQENAWKEQVKEQRVKELSNARKSAPEVRTKRDAAVDVKIIGNQEFADMLSRASKRIEAQSELFLKEGDPSEKYNKNNTIRFELDKIENQGDVGHAMGTNTDDPDGPGTSPRGRVLDNVNYVARGLGKAAWEGTKLGVGAALAVGSAFSSVARAANFVDDRNVYAELREPSGSTPPSSKSRSSSAAPSSASRRARRSTELPEEAPAPPKIQRGRSRERLVGRPQSKVRALAQNYTRVQTGVPGY
jgi:hypothetical protein